MVALNQPALIQAARGIQARAGRLNCCCLQVDCDDLPVCAYQAGEVDGVVAIASGGVDHPVAGANGFLQIAVHVLGEAHESILQGKALAMESTMPRRIRLH